MTPEILAASASVFLSLLFSYVPGFKTWYEAQQPTYKRLIMLALLVLVAVGSFAAACAQLGDTFHLEIVCRRQGAVGLLSTLLAALVANQSTFLISPKSKAPRADAPRLRRNAAPAGENSTSTEAETSSKNGTPKRPRARRFTYFPVPEEKRSNR